MSIRGRLVASHFILVVVVVLIVGLVSLGLVRGFILRSAAATLVRQAENIVEVIDRRVFLPEERAVTRLAPSLVRLLSTLTGADFLVIGRGGRVLLTSDRLGSLTDGVFLPQVATAAMAERTAVSDTFRDPLGRLSLVVVVPVLDSGASREGAVGAGATVGAVALVRPVVEVDRTTRRLVFLFFVASLVGLGLSLLASVILARTMTRPLVALEGAAAKVAAGDFSQRVEVTGDELGRVASSFNRMAARLGELRRERQDLYANVSHELRTPVTSIKGFAQALADSLGRPEDQKRYLAIIQEEASRLERLVSDLFQLARLEAGQVTFEWRPVDLERVVLDAVERALPEAVSAGIDLRVEKEPSASAVETWVRGDPDRLDQVLANLIENALRFTPPGGWVKVAVRAIKKEEAEIRKEGAAKTGGTRVSVSVRDSGPGIPEEDLARVFERFYTVERSRARKTTGARKTGTGLGLAIVREIIEAHGGDVRAERDSEGGARLVFALPQWPAPAGPESIAPGTSTPDQGEANR